MKTFLLAALALLTQLLHSAQPRIVFHEIVNPGPGKLVHGGYNSYPAMSGDGRTVVYSVNRTDGQKDMFAINTDGTGQRSLGVFPGSSYHPAISYNGALAAMRMDWDLFTLDTASGAPVKRLTMSDNRAISAVAVNDNGTKVYFAIRFDNTILNTQTILQGGVHEMNPDGSGRRLVTSLSAMKTLVGGDASAWVGGGYAAETLAISRNNRLVFAYQPYYATSMNQIMGVNADGTGLHAMGPQVLSPNAVTISRDGSLVAFDQNTPSDLHTLNWDGTNHVVQVVPGRNYDPLRLTENGSHFAMVDRLLRSDGGTVRSLRSGTSGSILAQGSDVPRLEISADGRKICSVKNFGTTSTLVMIELDPDNLRGAPDISHTAMTPGFVVHLSPGPPASIPTTATVTAQVAYQGTPNSALVYANLFLNGLPDPVFYPPVGTLFDDATNGDAIAGNGLYTQNQFNFGYPTTAFGPRMVRFVSENTVGGLRHATMVDHEPFFVLAAPPSGSAPAITGIMPNPGTAGGTLTISGTNFGITRTGNVVTLGGYSGYVASANAGGTQLTVEVPHFFLDGDHPVIVSANGQHSAPFPWRIGAAPAVPDIHLSLAFGLEFGDVAVGQTKDLAFAVQNTGTADLTVTGMNLSPAPGSQWFSRVSPALPFTVAAGGSTQVTVRCSPTAVRLEIGDFALISNDPDESPKFLEMSANGTAAVTPPPATAGISDSFNRGDSNPCTLGRADLSFGGSGNHYYIPIFPLGGATITGQRLVNATNDYGGVMLSNVGGCAASGGNVGREYNISVRLSVPTDASQRITQAGPFFHGRGGFAFDGVIGGANAGYWVQLHSTGEVKIKNLQSTLITATSGVPAFFDPSIPHQLEIAVMESSLQVALDWRRLWFRQDSQTVPVVSTPATGGNDDGSAGIAFGCEPNRGLIGHQWADNLVVGPYRTLLTLPDQDNFQAPPAATLSDSFSRANAGECELGAVDHALGGSGAHYYIPVFTPGAVLTGNSLANPGLDYSGVQISAAPNCTGNGANLGTSFNLSLKLLVPTGTGGAVTEAGPYFGNRSAAPHDGILGGQSAGYWVRLHSTGEVTVKNCHSTQIAGSIAFTNGTPHGFDSSAWHRLEIAYNNGSLQVALDGRQIYFRQGTQEVTTLTLPATGGSPDGGTGIAFGAEQNRGMAGGQRADEIVLTSWRSLGSLPTRNNFTRPAPLTLDCPVPSRMKVSWPQAGYDGYQLEVTDSLSSGWTPLLVPPASAGSQLSVEFELQHRGFFFRLVKP